jgi:hypothetical protein
MRGRIVSVVLEVAAGVAGGAVGYFAFLWLVDQNFYGLMLPGALIGLGCGLVARRRSVVRGLLCALAALGLELFAEWKAFPFDQDGRFRFMVRHFLDKEPIKIVMLLAGAAIAFWLGRDAARSGRPAAGKTTPPAAGPPPTA